MIKNIPVSIIMAENIVKLNLTDSLTYAEKLFKKFRIKHLPVVCDGELVGILSQSDLIRISLAESNGEDDSIIDTTVYNLFSIEQVMVKEVITVQISSSIKTALEIIIEKGFRSLPVMESDVLVGMITSTDLFKYLVRQIE